MRPAWLLHQQSHQGGDGLSRCCRGGASHGSRFWRCRGDETLLRVQFEAAEFAFFSEAMEVALQDREVPSVLGVVKKSPGHFLGILPGAY